MRSLPLPAFLLLALAAFVIFFGGLEGAGVLALSGAFLVAFALVLFRRVSTDSRAVRNRRAEDDKQFLWMIVLVGILVRVALALGLRMSGFNEAVAPDEYTFHDNGQYFAAWLHGDVGQPFSYKWASSMQVGYFAVVGVLYATFGDYPVIPVLLNCLVGGLCAYPAYLVAARVAGRPAGRGAAVLVTFFPSLVLWSALLIRDALVLYLILWCACLAQSLLDRFRLRSLVWLLACLAILATLRSYLFVLLAAAAVMSFLVAGVRRPGRAILTSIACVVAVLAMMKGAGLGTDYLADASLKSLALRRQYNAITADGAIALEGHDLATATGALTYLPVGLAWFLFSPFPWQFSGRQGLAVPEVLLWYLCIPFLVRGLYFAISRRRHRALVAVLAGVMITLLYSLVEGNVGIIFRHRAQALVLALPFVAIGWARGKAIARGSMRRAMRPARKRPGPYPRRVTVPA